MRVLGKDYIYPCYILKCEICNTYLEYNAYDSRMKSSRIYKPYIKCPVCNSENEIGYDDPVIEDYKRLNNS